MEKKNAEREKGYTRTEVARQQKMGVSAKHENTLKFHIRMEDLEPGAEVE